MASKASVKAALFQFRINLLDFTSRAHGEQPSMDYDHENENLKPAPSHRRQGFEPQLKPFRLAGELNQV